MAQIDINDFDAIKIGLASPKQIRDWSMGEVTKPETINYRTLKPERDGLFCERIFGPTKDWECYCGKYKRVRYKGIICERCGVEVTRQKVRRERMGHIDLAAPVSHIWFFKGVPSRIGYLLDIAPRELEKVLYFAASIVTAVDNEKRAADLADLEDKVRSESEQIYVDRDEQLTALEGRLTRRRDYLAAGKERSFDEDDEFWVRSLNNWAEDQVLPGLEEVRTLAGGVFKSLAKSISLEDAKKIRELVRSSATRDDRRLAPRELESVAVAAEQILQALDPIRTELEKASGSKKGALTKRLHKIQDALLSGQELQGEDAELVTAVDVKNLERAREAGNGILGELLKKLDESPETGPEAVRELASDLCLVEGARKDDLDVVTQWAMKVREMAQDIEQRREDAREASVEGVRRLEETWKLFRELEPKLVVNDEQLFRELKDRFGSPYGFGVYFRGGMGAEAIRDLLRDLDLVAEARMLRDTIKTSKGQKQQRAIKRLKVVSAFMTSENKPEWMVLEAVPVIPPELRPMVQLDGGRFATSDLNDLYRRVINRNNRLKRLLDLGAPEIIVNNEKRMLQEAVDALFDNGRRGRAVTGPGNRALKSLSDMLKGKQGRFRQNLLGKRVDYSGRSVIVAGPQLKLHQCGLPKLMALELFKPFIMSRLVERKSVQNIKAAKKHVESMVPEVWDVLEEVIAEHPVLLNRAPTLHRLGIQAFEPVLVEGKAIQVHPLVCHAFNADFDGDQMAVHVPLSAEAQAEARILMLSSNNILSPAHGRPLATPTQDMVLGAYFLTYCKHDLTATSAPELAKTLKLKGLQRFQSEDEVEFALDAKQVGLQEPIEYRQSGETRLTTPGRVIFGAEIERSLRDAVLGDVHEEVPVDRALTKRELDGIIDRLVGEYGPYAVASTLDTIKSLAFRYATRAGVTISKNDIVIPPTKEAILARYEEQVAKVEREYERGLMTEEERKERVTAIWTEATEEVAEAMKATLHETNPVFMMANSGARGSFNQIRQLAGMRGLMANPKGEIIERPIKANFMEGLTVLEYFISTHGARKGLADTALRTADSGYLTRRLVDVSQDVIVRDEDCGSTESVDVPAIVEGQLNPSAAGQMLAEDVRKPLKDGKPGKTVLGSKGEVLSIRRVSEIVDELADHVDEVLLPLRSVLKCKSEHGVCRACYGTFLATGDMCEIGDAVGIVAAQSIGEPGTQLTMRTFHTGGVAGADITHGLPRVVEIFEARNPKGAATLADVGGKIEVEDGERTIKVTVVPTTLDADGEAIDPKDYSFPRRTRLLVKQGDTVESGEPLNEGSLNPSDLLALHAAAGKGSTPTEQYLVGEVQKVYKSQGVDIHDKHIELIVRQMLKKVRVESAGDTDLLPGQLVDRVILEKANVEVKKSKKGEQATFEPLILGITKASLATESFLSAASFQETTKVLTDAAIEGKTDRLHGLKENVIIGKLIPAATGLRKYRSITIEPTEPLPLQMFGGETEAELLAALEEIGDGDGIDLGSFGLAFDENALVEELDADAAPESDGDDAAGSK